MSKSLTQKKKQDRASVTRSAGVVSIAVMFSRILGLIREQVFAAFFGAGTANDAFVVAFRIPNLLRDLFGEGALSTAFVKVFTEYDQTKTKEQTWQLASIVLLFFTLLLSSITLIAIFFSDTIILLFAPEFGEVTGKLQLTIFLTRIMMPFLVFISISAVVMGILNTKGRFFIPALASSFFNLGSIVGGVGFAILLPHYQIPAITGMAIGTLIGGFLQLAIQLPWLFKEGFQFTFSLNFNHPGLVKILKLMIPAVIGLSATQINVFINTSFAASCTEGSVSWLQYSFRLVQLPIGVFGVAIGVAAMPQLAKHAAHKDIDKLRDTFVSSLLLVFSLTIPAAAGLYLLSDPIIALIFERGAFTAADTLATAQALSLYSLGLFAYASNKVIVPVFYAIEKTIYPVLASFLAIIVNIVFITATIHYLEHLSIALSMSITMFCNFLFLCCILYRKIAGYDLLYLAKGLGKILGATAGMALVITALKTSLSGLFNGGTISLFIAVFITIVTSVGIYALLVISLRLGEFADISQKLFHRFSRK